MQRIGLAFILWEIFDLAHYDTSAEDFARIQSKGIQMYVSCAFKNILDIAIQLCTVKIKYIFVQKRSGQILSFNKMKTTNCS